MKITKSKLKNIIKEELQLILEQKSNIPNCRPWGKDKDGNPLCIVELPILDVLTPWYLKVAKETNIGFWCVRGRESCGSTRASFIIRTSDKTAMKVWGRPTDIRRAMGHPGSWVVISPRGRKTKWKGEEGVAAPAQEEDELVRSPDVQFPTGPELQKIKPKLQKIKPTPAGCGPKPRLPRNWRTLPGGADHPVRVRYRAWLDCKKAK